MLRKLKFAFFIILFLNFLCLGNNYLLAALDEEVTKLIVGETHVVAVRTPSRIVIGNPQVVDIARVTNSEITLNAKAPGATTLVFWDVFGEQSLKLRVVAEDMSEIKWRVDNILKSLNLPDVSAQAADAEAKVLLLGKVKTAQDRERIALALGPLKEKTVDLIEVKEEETVVEIDVQVLELDKDATKTLGFTWPGSLTLTESSGPISTAVTGIEKIFHVSDYTRTAFNFKLDALVQEGKARVLSRPRLACQSGKEAELMVGGEKPIFATYVTEGGSIGATVEYKEYGIKLKIKPMVQEEEQIKLSLNVQVSELQDVESLGSIAKAYPITKRTASTELFLNNGQTMAIGGLIKQKSEEDLQKVPWLADVPVLGLFFRHKTTKLGGGQGERGNVELFITLTPNIVGEKKEVAAVEIKPQIVSPPFVEGPSTPLSEYARIIQKRILENLTYPRPAKEAGFQGKVKLNLHLSYQGELLDAAVKDSSGYKMLDDNALSTAKNISTYPPFPPTIEQQELWIEVPISYRLD